MITVNLKFPVRTTRKLAVHVAVRTATCISLGRSASTFIRIPPSPPHQRLRSGRRAAIPAISSFGMRDAGGILGVFSFKACMRLESR
jgi:hypothetical protein